MNVIIAIDDRCGMMFNKRRQSQDKNLRHHILQKCKESKLWMNEYSKEQFEDNDIICVDEEFLSKAQKKEYAFVENKELLPFADKIDNLIICRWNRSYPGDLFLDIEIGQGWTLIEKYDIVGSSHEKITIENFRSEDK